MKTNALCLSLLVLASACAGSSRVTASFGAPAIDASAPPSPAREPREVRVPRVERAEVMASSEGLGRPGFGCPAPRR